LPKLNAAIWDAIDKYGAGVFPKLNWTSPKVCDILFARLQGFVLRITADSVQDAAFIIPQTSHGPLYCTTPSDIYLLLKSSDFIPHDLDPATAYEGCDPESRLENIRVELVLRKYVTLDPAREFRCFVRGNILLGQSSLPSWLKTADVGK
jgi:hypothetical protein